MTCIINDQTGELGSLCEQIAAELPNCRKIDTFGRNLFDEKVTLYIEFWLDEYSRPLVCHLRNTVEGFAQEDFSVFIANLKSGIRFYEFIGPPYKIEVTETSYKAYYTPEQKRRMNEPLET